MKSLIFGLTLTAIFAAAAIVSFLWTPYDVTVLEIANKLKAPYADHWFGTDHFGRDIFSMIMAVAGSSVGCSFRSFS